MTTNPFYNALFALAYIIILITAVFLGGQLIHGEQASILYPMCALSAALMAYLFFYQPVIMFLDGKREEGVKLFLKTVGIFACGTAIILIVSLIVNR